MGGTADAGIVGTADAGLGGSSNSARYVIAQTIYDTDYNPTGYFQVVSSLSGSFTLKNAIEVPGGVGVFGAPGAGRIWVGNGESPTIQRWAVSEDGILSKDGAPISLSRFGISSTSAPLERVPFISPTKAYFIEGTGETIVVWNPDTMEITGSIDVTIPGRDGFRTNLEAWPTLIGNRLYIAFGWWDFANARVALGAGVVVIDTASDAVVNVTQDPRCAGIFHSAAAADGFIYYACGVYPAAAHRIAGNAKAPESCLLRVKSGDDKFDPNFYVPIANLTGGRPGGELVGRGADLFIRAFHEKESGLTINDQTTTFDMTSAVAWRWWRLGAGASSAQELNSIPLSAAGSAPVVVDGRVFTSQSNAAYSESVLVELNAAGGPVLRATAVGEVSGLVRVR
jgi:hypothetical protein